jgi:hypothetical protein
MGCEDEKWFEVILQHSQHTLSAPNLQFQLNKLLSRNNMFHFFKMRNLMTVFMDHRLHFKNHCHIPLTSVLSNTIQIIVDYQDKDVSGEIKWRKAYHLLYHKAKKKMGDYAH